MGEKRTQQRWRMALTIITLLALIGMGYALRHQIMETFRDLGRVNTWALFFIVPLSVWNFDAQARLYQGIFRVLGSRVPYKKMLRITTELNFVNTIFPSAGVSGFSYFGVRMRSLGISTAQATFSQMMKMILIFISFQVMLFVGLIFLAFDGRVNSFLLLISASLATLLLVGTLLLAYIIGSKSRINAFFTFLTVIVNRIIHVFRRHHPETINITRAREVFTELHENYLHFKRNMRKLQKPLFYALLTSFTEVAAIYAVYVAFGYTANPGALIIAYAVANFAGLVSVLPGGVGIYEALMTAVLAAGGIPPSVSLPVTIMYRVLSMTLKLPIGYVLYHKALGEVSGVVAKRS
ncbi:MAG: hypothetical protein JWL85_301 [Candidatus Saccharibacteria bacterium]|nr:hypothetical protein [Candidatus Saccharibacteria bacterium]